MWDTSLSLPCVTIRDPLPGTSVRIAECDLTRAVVATSHWCDLSHLLRLDLLAHASAYLLVGFDENTGQTCLRVGSGVELHARLYDQRWNGYLRPIDEVFVLTTGSPILSEADIAFWRTRLGTLAWSAGRVRLVRGRASVSMPAPPARKEMLESLLAQGRPLLRAAGCPWLEPCSPDSRRAAA
ncbi:hypothetical protein IC232_11445 [Microvirga sp. BT688]|uniref:hypothetical protein n=1 Tax=Microvirga sp. TaxID=1873136 RepID=UPI0016840328|nr:hypothetical protein [Microvirga sp.]MBD2747306.1 hypothetical protein [Microvirga sp.]